MRGVRRRLRVALGLKLLSRSSPVRRRVPSVRAAAVRLGVHRNTAAALYADLARLGLLEPRTGAGTWTRQPIDPSAVRALRCSEPELAAVLGIESGRPVRVGGPEYATALLPLDVSPSPRGPIVPVAPDPRTLHALARVPAAGEVVLISESPALGRLMRAVLDVVVGPAAGLERIGLSRPRSSPGVVARERGALVIADACSVGTLEAGTPQGRAGFVHLRLLPIPGRRSVDPGGESRYTRRPARSGG